MSQVQTKLDVNDDGTLIVQRSQDVQGVLDRCLEMNHSRGGRGEDMHLAAELPMILVEKYCNDNGITFDEWMANPEHVRRMVNDPALSHFRVWGGRV